MSVPRTRWRPRRLGLVVACAITTVFAVPAWASSDDDPSPSASKPETSAGTTSTPSSTVVQPPATARDPAKFKRFADLSEPGLTTTFPGPIDTITGDVGGWRSALADHDIGIEGRLATTVMQNVLDTGQPRSPQRYNGQRFTLQAHALNLVGTIGLGGLGLPDSKLIVGGTYLVTSYKQNGPSTVTLKALAYYQTFADGAVEVKAGVFTNYYEFVGLFAGGSPLLSSGLSGLIPIQVGLSADPAPTPSANVTFNGRNGLYAKFAVQRSTSPLGPVYEVEHNNIGLKFSQRGAGALTIEEFGVRRPASAGGHQIWLRAGAIQNASDYTRFDGAGTSSNRAYYLLGDYQLTQPDQKLPFRGVYAGVSAFYARPSVNVYTQTYEARVYAIGLSEARPTDAINFRVTYNKFSKAAQVAYRALSQDPNPDQLSATLGYSMHVAPGVYVIPSAAYLKHPSFTGDFKDALTLSGTIYVLL